MRRDLPEEAYHPESYLTEEQRELLEILDPDRQLGTRDVTFLNTILELVSKEEEQDGEQVPVIDPEALSRLTEILSILLKVQPKALTALVKAPVLTPDYQGLLGDLLDLFPTAEDADAFGNTLQVVATELSSLPGRNGEKLERFLALLERNAQFEESLMLANLQIENLNRLANEEHARATQLFELLTAAETRMRELASQIDLLGSVAVRALESQTPPTTETNS